MTVDDHPDITIHAIDYQPPVFSRYDRRADSSTKNQWPAKQMNDDTGTLTLAFSLSAIDRLDDPKAVFEDAAAWSDSLGIVDADTDRIARIVEKHDLRQDFDMQGRDKWFALEEICETHPTARHVYVGASDNDMRVSTLFDWEYIRVTAAADNADWAVAEPPVDQGLLARWLHTVRSLLD